MKRIFSTFILAGAVVAALAAAPQKAEAQTSIFLNLGGLLAPVARPVVVSRPVIYAQPVYYPAPVIVAPPLVERVAYRPPVWHGHYDYHHDHHEWNHR